MIIQVGYEDAVWDEPSMVKTCFPIQAMRIQYEHTKNTSPELTANVLHEKSMGNPSNWPEHSGLWMIIQLYPDKTHPNQGVWVECSHMFPRSRPGQPNFVDMVHFGQGSNLRPPFPKWIAAVPFTIEMRPLGGAVATQAYAKQEDQGVLEVLPPWWEDDMGQPTTSQRPSSSYVI